MRWQLSLAVLALLAGPALAERPPNIVFILADDLGYGDLGCYGQTKIRTPHLDQLAKDGVRFTQVYAGSTVCAPSRCALLTGLHTGHCRTRGNGGAPGGNVPLAPGDGCVAELLQKGGYATALVGKWGLGEAGSTGVPTKKGFAHFFGYLNQTHAHNYYPDFLWRGATKQAIDNPPSKVAGVAAQANVYAPDLFLADALTFLDANKAKPFFLYYATTAPHANNEKTRATGEGNEVPSAAPYTNEDWPQAEKNKAAMITRLDADVGKLLARIKELGIERDTVVIFTSDNGPHQEGGNKVPFFASAGPHRGFKRSLTDGGIRVPAIVRWPGHVKPGQVSDHVWAFWDFLPTACDLAGVATPPGLDGISLAPLLRGKGEVRPHEFLYWEFHERGFAQGVRHGDWKAIRPAPGKPLELYDVRRDPGEKHDVAADNAPVVARIEAYLKTARTESKEFPIRAPKPPADKLNVLLIVADDLRTDLGCYGSVAQTPHLDALAARGVRFERAYCQQALCNPSRSSFLTGKRPDTLHLWSNGTHFREKNPEVTTLPLWFKENGYETRGVGKIFHNWHTKEKGDRRSWSADEFLHYANHGDDKPEVKGELPPNRALPLGRDYLNVPLCERRDVPDEAYYDGRIAREAVRTLGAVKDKPFFLAIGFWKPHAPFNAPKKYWDRYDPKKLPPLDAARAKDAPALAFHDSREILGIAPQRIEPNAAQMAEMRHGYFANISYLDAQVGKVLAALDEHKLTERTVVVFMSDHGYHLGEQGLWGKTSCFEFDARVPLLVAVPGMKSAGKSSAALVELVDLFPTVAESAGLPVPAGLDGTSFLPLLNDPTRPGKVAAFTQHPRPAYFDRTEKGLPDALGYSVRTPTSRYTEWRDWASGKVLGAEFYDHTRDPRERTNRLDAGADLKAAREALHAQFPPATPPAKR